MFVSPPTGYGKSLCYCLLLEFWLCMHTRGFNFGQKYYFYISTSMVNCVIFSLLTAFSSIRKHGFLHTVALHGLDLLSMH